MMEHPTPTVALILIGSLLAGCAVAGDIDGADKAIVPGRLKAVPTLLCVGLHWEVQGDLNGNAVATVAFREAGAVQWKKAMSLLRVVPQKVDVENDTCGGIKVIFLRGLKAWPKRMRQILIDRNTKNQMLKATSR